VYAGFIDKFPFGAIFAKGLTVRAGQCDVHKYVPKLLDLVRNRAIDTSSLITHRVALDDAAHAYRIFNDKTDGCVKVVLRP